MECAHGRIKSVNCVIFCDICGAKLPPDFVPGKRAAVPAEAVKTADNAVKRNDAKAEPSRRKKA